MNMGKLSITFSEKVFNSVMKALAWDGRERAVYVLCEANSAYGKTKLLPKRNHGPVRS